MKKLRIIYFSAFVLTLLFTAIGLGACKFVEECEKTTYKITATLNAEDMTVTAHEDVAYCNTSDAKLDGVYFHLYPSAFREGASFAPVETNDLATAYPKGVDYGGITVESVTVGGEQAEWEIIGEDEDILSVSVELLPTDVAEIGIDFTLDLPQTAHRFGYCNGTINLGNWYPIASVYEDGAFRTDPYYAKGDPFYSETADYEVSFTAPTGWNVAGTGSISTTVNGEETTTDFKAKNVRDFALTASTKYNSIEKKEGDVTVRYYYVTDDKAEERLALAANAVRTFSELFGAYAYDCLSVAQTPFLYGGMEYPQMVFVSSSLSGSLYEEAIVHEIAHQWWYSAVGNDQINEAWLDEGLAEYSTTLFYENNASYGVNAEDRIADAMQSYVLFNEVYKEQIKDNTAMNRKLSDYFSSSDYSFHTYVKGELLFDSLRHTVGDEKFFTALKNYYSAYSGKIATCEGLISEFEKASGMPLEKYIGGWVSGAVGLY